MLGFFNIRKHRDKEVRISMGLYCIFKHSLFFLHKRHIALAKVRLIFCSNLRNRDADILKNLENHSLGDDMLVVSQCTSYVEFGVKS